MDTSSTNTDFGLWMVVYNICEIFLFYILSVSISNISFSKSADYSVVVYFG